MNIIEVTKYSEKVLEAVNRLLPQLSGSAQPLDKQALTDIIDSKVTHLLMAEEAGQFCGSLTLVTFRIPAGMRARIEDVVVSESARGKGAGQLLLESAVKMAGDLGSRTVELTSRPSRQAANRLYRKVGFSLRETNVYLYEIS